MLALQDVDTYDSLEEAVTDLNNRNCFKGKMSIVSLWHFVWILWN